MKKAAVLILVIIMGSMILTSCFGLLGVGTPSEDNTSTHKATPEEAVNEFIERKELNFDAPHSYLVIDKYIFMLYNDVIVTGMYDEKNGYEMYLPWNTKSRAYIPETPSGLLSSMAVMKINEDYLIEIHGGGISAIEENSPIKVYDNQGNELEKLYNKDQKDGVCVWITVLNELPEDYAIYAEDGKNKYTVIDAEKIKKLVG